MDIDTRDHPLIAQKTYTLPLEHSQWVYEELEMLEKAGIISRNISPWFSHIAIVPEKTQPGKVHQKCLCIDYYALNWVLTSVLKSHSKVQSILYVLVSLPNVDELCAYFSLDCTSGYHHIALSLEAQKVCFNDTFCKVWIQESAFWVSSSPHTLSAINKWCV